MYGITYLLGNIEISFLIIFFWGISCFSDVQAKIKMTYEISVFKTIIFLLFRKLNLRS